MFSVGKKFFNKRYQRYYKRSRLYLIIDIVLIVVVIILAIFLIKLKAYQPNVNFDIWSPSPGKQEINLNNPPLELSFEIDKQNIYWENGVHFSIRLKNNSQEIINNVILKISSQSGNYNLSKLEYAADQKTSLSGTEIKGYNLYLDELSPGISREVNLIAYIMDPGQTNRTFNLEVDSEYRVLGQTITSSHFLDEVRIASEIQVIAASYYNSPQGDQLGSGPFPPVNGIPTKLWTFFTAHSTNDFKDFVMSAKLADNVTFTGNKSLLAGNLNYNPETRQIIWQVENISGEDKDSYLAGFEIELIPDDSQIGEYAPLITSARYQAIDYYTGLPVNNFLADIDTSLQKDAINKNEGRVENIDNL